MESVGPILDLIVKGLGVVSTLVAVGRDAEPAIAVLTDLATGAKTGAVTPEQLASTETTLDGMVAEFNTPL